MTAISKQILYDEDRHPVKVLLDYSDWLKIQQALGGKDLEPNGNALNAYSGKIDFGSDPLDVQRSMRSEWPN